MHQLSLPSLVNFLTFVTANPLSHFPIVPKDEYKDIERFRPQAPILNEHAEQLPFNAPSAAPDSSDSVTLELEAWSIFGIPIYTTPIAVGSPNQVFRVWLDLGFSGLVVRSADCGATSNFECGYGGELGFKYNHSTSSTYQDGDEDFHFMLPAQHVYGRVAIDDVHLVKYGLEGVVLGEVEEFYGENYLFLIMADIADGALGLAPPNPLSRVPYSQTPQSNILSHLLAQAPLAKPLISFTTPKYYPYIGSLTLGALPTGHSKLDLSIPFTGGLGDDWRIPNTSFRLLTRWKKKLDFVPSLSTPGFAFPADLTADLYKRFHALPDGEWDIGQQFNCSYRGHLPNISFDFPNRDYKPSDPDKPNIVNPDGSEKNTTSISFTEAEYTLHGFLGDEEVCLLTIRAHEERPGGALEDVVFVGEQLWSKWHVVFDLTEGEESMGLIERGDEEGGDGEGKRREDVDFAGMRRKGRGGR